MRRIVVFHPEEESPRFMWVPFETCGFAGFVKPKITEQLSFAEDATSSMRITNNAWTGTCLPITLSLKYADDFIACYPASNRAVIRATDNKSLFKWRGPLLAFCGWSDIRGDIVNMKDVDMRTFSALAAFLVDYSNRTLEHALRKGSKVECVKVNCNGERRVNGAPRYELVKVPASHPVFDGRGSKSQVSVVCDLNSLL